MTERRALSSRILRNTIFNSFGRVSGLAVAFVLTPFVLNRLGPDHFGVWALTTALISYIQILDMGLGASFVKYVAECEARGERESLSRIASTGFYIYATLCALLALLGIVAAPWIVSTFRIAPELVGEATTVWRLTLVVFAIDYTFSLFDALIQGLQRMDVTNMVAVSSAGLQAITTILVLALGGGLVGIALARLVVEGVTATALLVSVRRLMPTLRLHPALVSRATLGQLVSYGSRIQIARIAELGILQLDKIVLGSFVGLAAVGFYEIAVRVVAGLKYLAGITTSAMVPAASEIEARGDRAILVELHARATKYLLLVGAPMMAMPVIAAPTMMLLWLGAPNPDAARIVRPLAIGYFVHLMTASGVMLARGIGKPHLEARYTVLLSVLNLGLSFALIPRLGLTGALIATPVALIIASLYFLVHFHRQVIGGSFLAFLVRIWGWPLVAVAVAGGVVMLVPWAPHVAGVGVRMGALLELAFRGSLFGALFAGVILLSPYLDQADRQLFRRMLLTVRARLSPSPSSP